MSTPSASAQRAPSAPERGTFPLDHFRECEGAKSRYVACLERHAGDASACVALSKAYLECRMSRELMTREEFTKLGFRRDQGERAGGDGRGDGDGGNAGTSAHAHAHASGGGRIAGLRGANGRTS